ncbi:MAG: helix-turn-helix domain-containing protein [Methylococcaceae bacterium]|nr:helix-turn-helix domain-containing protein [Methylococcaceae bacterium]MDP2394325.1 helix-turn-helix domain-containing protein [Methylococcaceae bacterium]MDP3020114.1 helix-turn-helix domain-containing protein [Methylococcaceae bacterium]MDP3391188.1 helix-turn-helix domain-containing protein [Methylococcaceae bacterium]MDP3932558.1 helix-turn-helix domain-containing protein [Methylococcaceae bacterium]
MDALTALVNALNLHAKLVYPGNACGHWLIEPNMSVERVAERCGYESLPAFSKAFKRHFGVSPGSFRRN